MPKNGVPLTRASSNSELIRLFQTRFPTTRKTLRPFKVIFTKALTPTDFREIRISCREISEICRNLQAFYERTSKANSILFFGFTAITGPPQVFYQVFYNPAAGYCSSTVFNSSVFGKNWHKIGTKVFPRWRPAGHKKVGLK